RFHPHYAQATLQSFMNFVDRLLGIGKCIMHSPRRQPVEAGNNRLGRAFAVGAPCETGERRA
ncbi:MAG: hypothetical protein WCC41_19865, partial [Rhodomicrobium sp.]